MKRAGQDHIAPETGNCERSFPECCANALVSIKTSRFFYY